MQTRELSAADLLILISNRLETIEATAFRTIGGPNEAVAESLTAALDALDDALAKI